jgi:phage tail-like protein
MPSTASGATVLSGAHFEISIDGTTIAIFSELSGINSEVEAQEYIASDQAGNVIHTKQFGKVKPPKVTLKRGLDGSKGIWAWHEKVLQGDISALQTCSLKLLSAATENGQPKVQITYILENAWPAKVDIAGMKAGSSDVIMETVEMVCDQIIMQS